MRRKIGKMKGNIFLKNRTLILATALALTLALIIFIAVPRPPLPKNYPTPVELVRKSQAQEKFRNVDTTPITPEEIVETLDDVCRPSWLYLMQTDTNELLVGLIHQQELITKPCQLKMKAEILIPQVQIFVDACQENLGERTTEEINTSCSQNLQELRQYVIRRLSDSSQNSSEEVPPDNSTLADQLLGGFIEIRNSSLQDIERNIQISDTLIERDPNLYSAIKSKLLSLLILEIKFKQTVDPFSYDTLYDELLEFQSANEREILLPGASPPAELSDVDSDLIHLPFLRLSALGDLDTLEIAAQEYIDAFPESYVGHLYLAEALWKKGDQETAVVAFKNGLSSYLTNEMTAEILNRIFLAPALERIYEIKP